MARQIAKQGDVFMVPLEDGTFGVGQVLIPQGFLGSMLTAFFALRCSERPQDVASLDLSPSVLLCCQLVMRDDFVRGLWPRVGRRTPAIPVEYFPLGWDINDSTVGALAYSSGLFPMFLSAYHGLRPWLEPTWHHSRIYDELLLPGAQGPFSLH
jgi:hypothetical protein